MSEVQEFQRIYRLTWLNRLFCSSYTTKVYEKVGHLKSAIKNKEGCWGGRKPVEGQDYTIEYADIPVFSKVWHPIEREEL